MLVAMHELAEVRFGFKTGTDRFFCVRDVTDEQLARIPDPAEFRDTWSISRRDTKKVRIVRDGEGGLHLVEARYLEPEFHTLMEAKSIVIHTADLKRVVINAPVTRAALRNTHLGRYVAYGEQMGWNTGPTVASRARVRPWCDLGLRQKEQRAHMFWPKSQQYRHIAPWNADQLPGNDNLYDIWARDGADRRLLWAVLNSTLVALSKHQFGRAAGIEGNLKTEVVDVNMMLVPDVRTASPEAAQKAVAAADAMAQRTSTRYLFEEFSMADRQQLDDAVLEILGFDDSQQRDDIRHRLYQAIEEQYQATREREILAQRDRRRSQNRDVLSASDIADEIWEEHSESLGLLQFPDDFLHSRPDGEHFDLPSGGVEVGTAMLETGRQLRVGTIRVGGANGAILEVGSVHKAHYLEAMADCGYYGPVRIPDDPECETAYQEFAQYKASLAEQFTNLAAQHTRDQRRQRAIVDALMRKALAWRRE
jgi:hypothetical protein